MPITVQEYFRARRIFSSEDKNHPDFRKMVQADRERLRRTMPKECTEELFWHSFEHEDPFIEGAWVINYFESEEEMMAAKAVHYEDDEIYREYIKNKNEQVALEKFKYAK